jgi:hypothetical protein
MKRCEKWGIVLFAAEITMWVLFRHGLPERTAFPWKRPNGPMFSKGLGSPAIILPVNSIARLSVHTLSKKPISRIRISKMFIETASVAG